jgi:hypothetical protein
MSNGTPAPAKKGLHPLAWVGIGCGVLIIIVMISFGALTWWGYSKVKEAGLDPASIKDNPVLAAARVAVMGNPDLEVVDADPDTENITIRNTKTGELITVNYEDLEEGRFSWTADGEEISVDVSDAESGTVKIESSDGDGFQLTTGDAVNEEIPDWVPVYPGTEPKNRGSMKTDEMVSGNYTTTTDDEVDEVLEYFRESLKSAGYEVNINTISNNDTGGGMINGSLKSEGRTIVVIVGSDEGATGITVTHTIKK